MIQTLYTYTIIMSAIIVTYVAVRLFIIPLLSALWDIITHRPATLTTTYKEWEEQKRSK